MKRLAYLCLLLIACGETEPENQSPMHVGTIPDVEMTTMADTAFDVSGYFTDDDGDTLMYRAESMDRTVAQAVVSGAVLRLTTYGKISSTNIEVVAMDPDTAEASLTFKVTAINQPPVVAQSLADRDLNTDTDVAIDLEPFFTDPENLPLAYRAESDAPATVSVSVSGGTLTISAGSDPGSTQVEVTATDSEDASVSQAFQVEAIARGEERLRDNFDGDLKKWKVRGTGTTMELDDGWLNVEMGQSAWTNWAYRPLEDTIADVKLVTKARYQSGGGVDLGFKVTGKPQLLTFSFGKNIQRRDKENSYVDYSVHWWLGNRWFSHSDLYGTSSMVPSAGTDFEIAVSVIGKDIRVEIDGDELLEFDFADYSDDEIGEVEYFGLGVIPQFTEIYKTTEFDRVVLYK